MNLAEHLAGYPPDLAKVILAFASGARRIAAGFEPTGGAGSQNVFGEEQNHMDLFADSTLQEAFRASGVVALYGSEELAEPVDLGGEGFSVVLDPLDGSSLVDVGLAVGSILGIFPGKGVLRPGSELAGAAYAIYGPTTLIAFATGHGLQVFRWTGETWELHKGDVRIANGKLMAPGGLRRRFIPDVEGFVSHLEAEGYKLRYSGAFVADVHQILHKGGIFLYPALEGALQGKLRLLYEGIPMAYLAEAAGGAGSDGTRSLLDIIPDSHDQRTPIILGGAREVAWYQERIWKQ